MPYQVQVFDSTGRQTGDLGSFGSVPSARQAMLDHSETIELPSEDPFSVPSMQIVEGWFIGRTEYTEYNILIVVACAS